MRKLILLDTAIEKDEALALLDEYADFLEETAGIKATFYVERKDFSVVPTTPDSDGDLKPTHKYRQDLCTGIHSRYNDYGVDDIVMWVAEDNFVFSGVWGVAWSYVHYKYNFLLCRWDKDNKTNTFNTLFHEDRHPDDTTILKETGVDIEQLLRDWILKNGTAPDRAYVRTNGFDYDRDYVHGNLPSVQYIGRRGYKLTENNLAIFKFIAHYLKQAHAERKRKHNLYTGKLRFIFGILSRVVELLSLWKSKQDSIPKK